MANNIKPSQATARRTVLKGAAWATPMAAVATASPAIAVSGPCVGMGGEWVKTTPGTYEVTIPDCITRVEYEVLGGGGAGPGESGPRGSGAVIKGELTLEPGTSRTLIAIVAAGGQQAAGGIGEGGSGFGRGGRGTNSSTGLSFGGGGGSALKIGNKPLVVAGGGGGGCRSGHLSQDGKDIVDGITVNTPNNAPGWAFGNRAAGGNAENGLCYGLVKAGMTSVGVLTYPAFAGRANGTGGNRGGGTRWITSSNDNWKYKASSAGTNGGDVATGANGGGNGGNGASPIKNLKINTSPVAGGGGGGYAGGGGGGMVAVNFQDYKLETVASGSGAAGSSFVLSGAVSGVSVASGTVQESGKSPAANRGHHGRIWLRWS